MYYAHFGLTEPPFKITPNTDFFYSGGNRGAILEALTFAIGNGEGIVKVVGEVGSGKTMLCRMLQAALPEKVESVYLANPSLSPDEILHAIAFELQLDVEKTSNRLEVMQKLHAYLIAQHEAGRQVVVFVEEAQSMPLETLEEIRLLSNLETKQDKLLQIILFGQPELDTNLNLPHIRQLKERITHQFYLAPFNKEDLTIYVDFRMRKAGYSGPPIFTPKSLKLLTKASEGLVRRANILADKALLACYAENKYQVSPKYMLAAIRDSAFEDSRPPFWSIGKTLYVVVLLSVLSVMGWHYQQHQSAYHVLFKAMRDGSVVEAPVLSPRREVIDSSQPIEAEHSPAVDATTVTVDPALPASSGANGSMASPQGGGWAPNPPLGPAGPENGSTKGHESPELTP